MAGTKPNRVSIQNLLNPISQSDCNMFGSRGAEDYQGFSETCEERSRNGLTDGMDNNGRSLNVGEHVVDGEPVDREAHACFRDSRSSHGRITSGDPHRSQGSNISQRLQGRNNTDDNDNDVQAPEPDSRGCHNLPVPSASGCVHNLIPEMISAAMQSVDSPGFQRTGDYQKFSSPQCSRGSIFDEELGEQFRRKPKATKRRKYLKRIGVPRYRTSSPLQPFGRRTYHREHPSALNVEHSQPPNMWPSFLNEYPTSSALAGPVAAPQMSRAQSPSVNEHPLHAVAVRQPELAFPTSASRSTFQAVQNPELYIVTDPSGFTFCTSQPPMNISPDFFVLEYPTTLNMASGHVHIVHRQ